MEAYKRESQACSGQIAALDGTRNTERATKFIGERTRAGDAVGGGGGRRNTDRGMNMKLITLNKHLG